MNKEIKNILQLLKNPDESNQQLGIELSKNVDFDFKGYMINELCKYVGNEHKQILHKNYNLNSITFHYSMLYPNDTIPLLVLKSELLLLSHPRS